MIGTITATVDLLPEDLTAGLVKPQVNYPRVLFKSQTKISNHKLAQSRCFFGEDGVIFYFHIVSSPILLANLVMFVLTSWNMCCGVYANTGIIQSQNRKRIFIALKLFFIMGITWLSEITSFIMVRINVTPDFTLRCCQVLISGSGI